MSSYRSSLSLSSTTKLTLNTPHRAPKAPGFEALYHTPWRPNIWLTKPQFESHLENQIQEINDALWASDGKDHTFTMERVANSVMMSTEGPPPYRCPYDDDDTDTPCGAFPVSRALMTHIYAVHCPKAYKCPWQPCDGPVSVHFGRGGLKEHVVKCHFVPVWYRCVGCEIVIRNRLGFDANEWFRGHLEVECGRAH
ncbi:hypothetical protein BDV23DRAFT_178621 [Aspergillus alliaceus]|uniref:Uncharacterized protein n=1 Tax=Petromyces alliaceus TaxID=209559 RepID=A0A5N7CMT9_PETAA|nr:hypothetical protein BDV23DRAFT_178621 [Aspergillus alliaceus]